MREQLVASRNCRVWRGRRKRGREGKRKGKKGGGKKKKRGGGGKSAICKCGKGGGGTRREEGGWRGIYVQRDQGEIEIETSGGVVGIRGGEGNEGIRSCDCTKFAVRTVASFRRDRNMHW